MNNSNSGCFTFWLAVFTFNKLDKIERNTRRTADLVEGALTEPEKPGAPGLASRERDKAWEAQLKKAKEREIALRVEQARKEMGINIQDDGYDEGDVQHHY